MRRRTLGWWRRRQAKLDAARVRGRGKWRVLTVFEGTQAVVIEPGEGPLVLNTPESYGKFMRSCTDAGLLLALPIPERWISVKDGMPAPGIRVLVYVQGIDEVQIRQVRRMGIDCWHADSGNVVPVEANLITHWYPLPGKPASEEV